MFFRFLSSGYLFCASPHVTVDLQPMHVHILKGVLPGGNPHHSPVQRPKLWTSASVDRSKPNAGRPLATLVCSSMAVGTKELVLTATRRVYYVLISCAWILVWLIPPVVVPALWWCRCQNRHNQPQSL